MHGTLYTTLHCQTLNMFANAFFKKGIYPVVTPWIF